MTHADALKEALARFDASVDSLEQGLADLLGERSSDADLRQQLRTVADERNRLASECERLSGELEAERGRSGRLEAANDEVAERLETVMGRLRKMMAAEGADF
jgi:predicted nuclease with TOPRIM domain